MVLIRFIVKIAALIVALFMFCVDSAYAQSIYAGGSGDGYSIASFAQATDPLQDIYHGGNEDGFYIATYIQADDPLYNIFKGGSEDGFYLGTYAQPDDPSFDIYKGGTDDGFYLATYIQASDPLYDIYKGGTDDGFYLATYIQASDPLYDIYKGGTDDGFYLATYIQASDPLYDIYQGGSEDGFYVSSYIQASDPLYDIYQGGSEDGFYVSSYVQASNPLYDIYQGGSEDGFYVSSYVQVDNPLYSIYYGGVSDGFYISSFVQADNPLYSIYYGGVGDGFTRASLGAVGSEVPLPIDLVSFQGHYQNRHVVIFWKTASEHNNDYFIIHKSVNGIDFMELHKVPGAGTTTEAREYSAIDENPFRGANYYKLSQTDFDGKSAYSKVITVSVEDDIMPGMIIHPNPATNTTTVQILFNNIDEGTSMQLKIINQYGQDVFTFSKQSNMNGNSITIPRDITNGLASGVYVIVVNYGTTQLTAKLVIN